MNAVKKGTVIAVLVFFAAVAVLWDSGIISSALFRTEDAVRRSYEQLQEVENSTLIVGTHFIYLHSLNDDIYRIAMDSASASGQGRIYYKSELAGGIWYDITDAGSIQDITSSGSIADREELEALYFTHHTKSDGITYNLATNEAMCIFDIDVIYELEKMAELEELKMQYDNMKESNSSDKTVKRNLDLTRNFFKTQVISDTTQECDRQLNALNGYYQELAASHAESKDTETVLKVMEKVDYARKAAVFGLVDTALSKLENNVNGSSSDASGDFSIDDALLTAIGNSQHTLSESITEAQGNMLAEGNTVISEMEYKLSVEMTENALAGNYAACDEQNMKLQYLGNISEERIVSREGELELLEELINRADIKYGVGLSSGETQDYKDLTARNVSHAALQNRIREDTAGAGAAKAELQFLIQGKIDRELQQDAETYVLQRIQGAAKFRSVIGKDAYEQEYLSTVEEYVTWLEGLLSKLKNGNSQSKEEGLYEQKADLQELKQKALDGLDLDTARRIDAQIAAVDEDILKQQSSGEGSLSDLVQQKAQIEKKLEGSPDNASLQVQLSSVEAQIAEISAGLEENSQAAAIMNSKKEALKLIAGTDTSQQTVEAIEHHVNVLTDFVEGGSPLALEALKEIYRKMAVKSELEGEGENESESGIESEPGSSGESEPESGPGSGGESEPEEADEKKGTTGSVFAFLQEAIEEAIAESDVRGSINASLSGELSAAAASSVIADSLGIDSLTDESGAVTADVSQEDMAAALIAMGEFGEQTGRIPQPEGSGAQDRSQVSELAQDIAAALSQNGEDYVFPAKKLNGMFYAPVRLLAEYAGYRYVWNDTLKNAILSRGRVFYSFNAFQERVDTQDGGAEYMETPAGFSGEIYVPAAFVESCFGCSIQEISGTGYTVFADASVMERAQEMLSDLLEEGGY